MMHFLHKLTDSRLVNEIGKNAVLFKGGCGHTAIGDTELFLHVFQADARVGQHDGVRHRFFDPF